MADTEHPTVWEMERFEIKRHLGSGGMGDVFEAYDHQRRSVVALKQLQKVNATSLYRFKKEFRELTDIAHPNLVSLYELISADDCWYIAMEMVHGVDLISYVRPAELAHAASAEASSAASAGAAEQKAARKPVAHDPGQTETMENPLTGALSTKPLKLIPTYEESPILYDERRLRSTLAQLVIGLGVLHAANKVHRDIKPSNVLVTPEGRAVLLDFGLVTEMPTGQAVTEDMAVGTALYMAPEQAELRPARHSADWYAVGCVLYQALTGRTPFVGTPIQVLLHKQQFEPPPPRQLVPDVPRDLDKLCEDLLRRDPSLRPSGIQVMARLGILSDTVSDSHQMAAASTVTRQKYFVGRCEELDTLRRGFETCRPGRGKTMVVHGRSGIGKSMLLRRFLKEMSQQESPPLVLEGRCYERESVPYKAFDGIVDAISQHMSKLDKVEAAAMLPADIESLVRLFPTLRIIPVMARAALPRREIPNPQELRNRAFRALRELLEKLAQRQPLVIFIDDLQWGDVDSAPLLKSLLARWGDLPILWLLCYRSEERGESALLRELFNREPCLGDAITVQQLPVGPLPRADASELVQRLLLQAGHRGIDVEAVTAEASGHPYFLHELVHYAASESGSPPAAGSRPSAGTPVTLDEAIGRRVSRLPKPAQQLLEAVAIAGRPVPQGIVIRVADLGEQTSQAMDVLRVNRLLRTMGTRDHDLMETFHDRIRESVLGRLPPEAQQNLHYRLALALEASERPDIEALVIHFFAANSIERAASYADQAADQAAEALAFERAAELYRLALEHSPYSPAERHAVTAKLGDALSNAGRCAEAARVYLSAVQGASAAGALEMHRRAAVQFLISGHTTEGLAALDTVLASVGMKIGRTSGRALLSFLFNRLRLKVRGLHYTERDPSQISEEQLNRIDVCWSVAMGLGLVDPIPAWDFQTRNFLLSLRAGDPYRIARALAFDACYLSLPGGSAWPQVTRVLEQCEQIARRLDNPHLDGLFCLGTSMSQFLQGRWNEALVFADEAEQIFSTSCTGVEWEMDTARSTGIWSLFYLGEIGELNRRFESISQAARAQGNLLAQQNIGSFAGFSRMLGTDDPGEARSLLQELGRSLPPGQYNIPHANCLFGKALVELYAGQGLEAWRIQQQEWPLLTRTHLLRVGILFGIHHYLHGHCALAAAAAAGDPVPLVQLAERDAKKLESAQDPWVAPLAELVRSGIAEVRGDAARVCARLRSAEKGFASLNMVLFAAVAQRRRGQLTAGDEGRDLVQAADARLSMLGVKHPQRAMMMFVPGASSPSGSG